MPQDITTLIAKLQSFFGDMMGDIKSIYLEKGFAPFKRPLVVAGPALLVIYAVIYSPINSSLQGSAALLENKRIISRNASEYEEARDRLAEYQRKLPPLREKEEWLNYITTSTARAYNITLEGIRTQTESEAGSFIVVSREVSVFNFGPATVAGIEGISREVSLFNLGPAGPVTITRYSGVSVPGVIATFGNNGAAAGPGHITVSDIGTGGVLLGPMETHSNDFGACIGDVLISDVDGGGVTIGLA